MNRHFINGPSIVSIDLKLQTYIVFNFHFLSLFCLFQVCSKVSMRLTTGLQVLMASKKDIVYCRGRSKSKASSQRMIDTSDNERDPKYVPPGYHAHYTSCANLSGYPLEVDS